MNHIQEVSERLKILSDQSRLTMLALLREEELCVCDLVELVGLSQPGVSQHLKKMKAVGIVNETRKSQWVYYSLNIEDKPYVKAILDTIPPLKDKIDAMKNRCC